MPWPSSHGYLAVPQASVAKARKAATSRHRTSGLRGLTGWSRSHSRCTGSCKLSPSCPSTSETLPGPGAFPHHGSLLLPSPACVPESLLERRCHPPAPAAACVRKANQKRRLSNMTTASSPRSTVRNSPARASRQRAERSAEAPASGAHSFSCVWRWSSASASAGAQDVSASRPGPGSATLELLKLTCQKAQGTRVCL